MRSRPLSGSWQPCWRRPSPPAATARRRIATRRAASCARCCSRDHQVVIEHDEIEGLMPAMTMSFDVPDHALLETLAAGQAIDFTRRGHAARATGWWTATVKGEAGSAGSSGSFSELASARDPAPDFELVDQNGAQARARRSARQARPARLRLHQLSGAVPDAHERARDAPAHAPAGAARAHALRLDLARPGARHADGAARLRPRARRGPRRAGRS